MMMMMTSVPLLVDWPAFFLEEKVEAATVVDVTKGSSATATLILDTQSELGEGILYDDLSNEVVWCDILGKRFHKLCLETGKHESFSLPKKLCSFGLLSSVDSAVEDESTKAKDSKDNGYKNAYLFAWEDGFQIVDPTTVAVDPATTNKQQPLTLMSEGEPVNPLGLPTRLNDGRCDPTGKRYICGGYYSHVPNCRMKVFACYRKETMKTTTSHADDNDDETATAATKGRVLAHEPILTGIRCANSLCFSPDGKTMYFADSPTQTIVAYECDNNPQATNASDLPMMGNEKRAPHPIYSMKDDLGDDAIPDGSCVDSDGYIWNAVWWHGVRSSFVQRIDPRTGRVVFRVHMPDSTSRVSCCCFGGPNLDILFITTAKGSQSKTSSSNDDDDDNANKEPNAGGVYAIKLAGVKGRLEHRFQV